MSNNYCEECNCLIDSKCKSNRCKQHRYIKNGRPKGLQIKCFCVICNNFIGDFSPSHIRKTCSKECKNKYFSNIETGQGNPNYKDGRCSKIYYCPDCNVRFSGRGKKCGSCSQKSRSIRSKHTEKSKKEIGKKSSEKFTEEYNNKIRKIMEDSGIWIKLNEINDYKLYQKFSNWIEKMFDRIETSVELQLLKDYGVFNSKKNSKGVVRDHKYSRKSGFDKGVFPELLRHPMNCEIMLHSKNISKKQKRYIDDDSQTLDDLFELIINYKGKWKEQNLCLQLIEKYKNGERYNKQNYIDNIYKN
jgi:hypothetical protein